MFDIGGWELALVFVLTLVLVRPEDLPAVMRALGRALRKIRKYSAEFQRHLDMMVDEDDIRAFGERTLGFDETAALDEREETQKARPEVEPEEKGEET